VKDLVVPGNLPEIMNKVLAADAHRFFGTCSAPYLSAGLM